MINNNLRKQVTQKAEEMFLTLGAADSFREDKSEVFDSELDNSKAHAINSQYQDHASDLERSQFE